MLAHARIAASLFLCTALGACSGATVDDVGPGPSPGPGPAPSSMSVDGKYTVASQFEISAADLGDGKELVEKLEDFAEDPVGELAKTLADELGGGFLGVGIEAAINELLKDVVDQEVEQRLSAVLGDLAALSVNFDVKSSMVLSGSADSITAMHRATGLDVLFRAERYNYAFNDMAEVQAPVTRSGSELKFQEHQLEIPYAEMLLTVVDNTVIPELDADAANLGDAIANLIDCEAVGQKIYDLGIFDDLNIAFLDFLKDLDAQDYAGFCDDAMAAAGDELYDQIADLDGLAITVSLSGDARMMDSDNDNQADRIDGTWNSSFPVIGDVGYSGKSAFSGVRTGR